MLFFLLFFFNLTIRIFAFLPHADRPKYLKLKAIETIERLQLDNGDLIGEGSYGKVFRGYFQNQSVIVKTNKELGEGNVVGENYLKLEKRFNEKLKRHTEKSRSNLLICPYLGSVKDKRGKLYLIWGKTGNGVILKDAITQGELVQSLIDIGIGNDTKSALQNLLRILANMVRVCHYSGICHRDIKPANIILDKENKTLRLIDFGSAADMKDFFRSGYNFEKSPCSPHYCAPEKFIDENYPWTFDVFSIGMIWLRCAFPHLHNKTSWNHFHDEFVAIDYNLDLWLQQSLTSDAIPGGMVKGLSFFQADGGRGWRLLKKMLDFNPKERISIDSLISDPYLVGAGGTVTKNSKLSKSFFETIVKEDIDVCAVEDQVFSIRVSLPRPIGLGLSETLTKNGLTEVTNVLPGSNAEKSKAIRVGDSLTMVGDHPCVSRTFEEVMDLIRTFPGKRVPLVLQRGSNHPRPSPDSPDKMLRNKGILDFGVSSMKGKRSYMEDGFCLNSLTITPFGEEDTRPFRAYLAGVFDGHRGSNASQFCAENFPSILRKKLLKRHRTSDLEALRAAWEDLHLQYLATGHESGCTASIALIVEEKIYVLNCGDSKVLVTSKGHVEGEEREAVYFATKDHSPSDPNEIGRIEKLGGIVECSISGTPKVRVPVENDESWLLGLSRCVGGKDWRNSGILPIPDITSFCLENIHDNVIVASDGIWEVMDEDACANFVHSLRNDGKSATEAAIMLSREAGLRGSADNITAVVAYLDSR